MKIKRWLYVLMVACLTGPAAFGQQSGSPPPFPPPVPVSPDGVAEHKEETVVQATSGLSDWVLGKRDCCEGKHGILTPLYTEFYVEAGPSFPVGGMTLSREAQTGWSIAGGLRAMFFNEPMTNAWVVDGHIINTNEGAGRQGTQFPVTVDIAGVPTIFGQGQFPGVTLKDINRTMVGVGIGRDWYLGKPADFDGPKWRVGVDAGGRYGSIRVSLNETDHLDSVAEGIYAGMHLDYEVPWRNLMFNAGVRFEWSYTWSDVLQRVSDIQDLHVFLTAGLRY